MIIKLSFIENLDNYLANPKNRNKPLDVCDTPNALLAIGAKQLPVVMNPTDVDKCLEGRTANKNKNSHDLSIGELMELPQLLQNPVVILKGDKENYITVVTDKSDKDGNLFVVGVELNSQNQWHDVNRIATMHGRERMYESFIAKNGNKVSGYVPRSIAEGKLLAINIEKAPEFLRSTGLQLPESSKFVSYDNSITQSMNSVKSFDENIFKEKSMENNNRQSVNSQPKYMDTPVGKVEMPSWIAEKFNKMDDIELMQDYLKSSKNFIDPFAFQYMVDRKLLFAGERTPDIEARLNKMIQEQSVTPETVSEINQNNEQGGNQMNREEMINAMLEDIQQGEPEDYGHEEGLKIIEENLRKKSDSELQAEYNEMQLTNQNDMEEHKEEMSMRARVTPIESETKLKGIASITFSRGVSVHDVKIVEGKNGLFLSMPGEKKGDEFTNFAVPKSKKSLAEMKDVVLKAYDEAVVLGKRQEKPELMPADMAIEVSNFKDNPYKNNIKGSCDVTIDENITIKDVKLIAVKETGELSIGLPTKRQDENGEYPPVVTATSKDSFKAIKEAVIDNYQNHLKTVIGNTPYNELGEEREVKSYNSEFAIKVGAELDADGVKWSGKIGDDNKTRITVNKSDAEKLANAAETAKERAVESKGNTNKAETPTAPPSSRGGRH